MIYDDRDGFVPIAEMKLNEPLVIQADYDDHWWQVKFGNGYGYILKKDAYRSTTWITENVNLYSKNSNTTVLTNVNTEVYDNSSGKLEPMVTIKAGYRYPVITSWGNFWKVDVGGREGYIAKSKTSVDKGIPVLMYHHILTPEEKLNSVFASESTTITTTEFSSQMEWLATNGYTTISLIDFEKYMNHTVNLPAKSIVITFDDGIVSTREYAYPILKQYGFNAEQFIITSRITSNPQVFNWNGLQFFSQQDMDQLSDVFNYGSHTHELHSMVNRIGIALTKPENDVYNDIQKSKEILSTNYIAYPFGHYDATLIKTIKDLKFTMALTTKTGKVNLGEDLYRLERIGIEPGTTIDEFARKVSN